MAGFSYIRYRIFGSKLSCNERFTFENRNKPYAGTVGSNLRKNENNFDDMSHNDIIWLELNRN